MCGVLPYTFAVVAPGNKIMMARWRALGDGKGEEEEGEGESRERVRRWGRLNWGRVVLPLVGAGVAWTTAW